MLGHQKDLTVSNIGGFGGKDAIPQKHYYASERKPGKFNHVGDGGRNVEEGKPQYKVNGSNEGFNWTVTGLRESEQDRDGCRKLIIRGTRS